MCSVPPSCQRLAGLCWDRPSGALSSTSWTHLCPLPSASPADLLPALGYQQQPRSRVPCSTPGSRPLSSAYVASASTLSLCMDMLSTRIQPIVPRTLHSGLVVPLRGWYRKGRKHMAAFPFFFSICQSLEMLWKWISVPQTHGISTENVSGLHQIPFTLCVSLGELMQ